MQVKRKMTALFKYVSYLQLQLFTIKNVLQRIGRSGLDSVCFAPLSSAYNEIPTQYGVKIYIVHCPRNIQRHFKYRVCV